MTYATLGGATLSLMVTALQGGMPPPVLEQVEHWLLAVNACLLATYVVRMSRLEPAARETVRFLLRGRYRRAFLGLVLLVGLMATLFLSPAQSRVEETSLAVAVAACELVGDFTLLMVLFRAGLYSPQMTPKSS